ncbi:hypothetical protein ACGFIJ_35495 [Microbispora bryophytorum]|uniref:hypothetical protein n=1 Tax=Microbispora bryophytorum TaxID=1460882 RepID=UPI00371CDA54
MAANPGCARRTLLDACGANKDAIATQAGFAWPFGQSPFALARGKSFESGMTDQGGARLLTLLRDLLDLPLPEVAYKPVEEVGGNTQREVRYQHTCKLLLEAARGGDWPGTLFDHPMLRLTVGGVPVYLEPDVIAFKINDLFYVVEIKSFPVIDRQADPDQVASAIRQASVYVIALREMLAAHGLDPAMVASSVILVTPKGFSNTPVATLTDARKQIAMLVRQLRRADNVGDLLEFLPEDTTFDLRQDDLGVATRSAADLVDHLLRVEARYRPACTQYCEMAALCRDEAVRTDSLDLYGTGVSDVFNGVDSASTARALAVGSRLPSPDQQDVAWTLRHAQRLLDELGGVA